MYVMGRLSAEVRYAVRQYANQGLRISTGLLNRALRAVGGKGDLKPWVPFRNAGAETICAEENLMVLRLSQIDVSSIDQDTVSPWTLRCFLANHPLAKRII